MAPKKKARRSSKDEVEAQIVVRTDVAEIQQNVERSEVHEAPPILAALVEPVPPSNNRLSVESISSSPIIALAANYWSVPCDGKDRSLYQEKLVSHLYNSVFICNDHTKCQMLELSGYLENYLWPYYSTAHCSDAHFFSILHLLNEKITQNSNAFSALSLEEEKCNDFFCRLIDLYLSQTLPSTYHKAFFRCLVGAFRSHEYETIKKCTLRYVAMPIWSHLSKMRLVRVLREHEGMRSTWSKYSEQKKTILTKAGTENQPVQQNSNRKKKRSAEDDGVENKEKKYAIILQNMQRDADFIPNLLQNALELANLPADHTGRSALTLILELVVELLSQKSTRRYLTTLLDDMHFLFFLKKSTAEDQTLSKLVEMINNYLNLEVNDITGEEVSRQEIMESVHERIHTLQQIAFSFYPTQLKGLVFGSMGVVTKRTELSTQLALLSKGELLLVLKKLKVYHDGDEKKFGAEAEQWEIKDLFELLFDFITLKSSWVDRINKLPLYPTETVLWDEEFLPSNTGSSELMNEVALALPKLNLQFLSIYDYFLRNFLLYFMECSYEIKQDLVDAIKRMGPRLLPIVNTVSFAGWARMALPISSISLDEVAKPLLGEIIPSHVDSTVTIDLSRFTGDIREEWEGLKEHDVVFLVCISNPTVDISAMLAEYEAEKLNGLRQKKVGQLKKRTAFITEEEMKNFMQLYGVKYIRGGEIFEVRDVANNILNDRNDGQKVNKVGHKRNLRLHLDPAQYHTDIQQGVNCYEEFNLLVRRKGKENTFKAVLQTIKQLLNSASVGRAIPAWLHDVLLGVGSAESAHYKNLKLSNLNEKVIVEEYNYLDTFLDEEHIRSSFPSAKSIRFHSSTGPYRLKITYPRDKMEEESLEVSQVSVPPSGPYVEDKPPVNSIRYTPTQIQAIRSGTNEGLTLIIGPPGTGKTDCAVAIIANLYHNFPTQKILVVTHSNAALNDIFEKIMQRDVDLRHVLRLGAGEADLRGEDSSDGVAYSKHGRVNWCLTRRLSLLAQVTRLAQSLNVTGDFGTSCETALHFDKVHIQPLIKRYEQGVAQGKRATEVFPFGQFFADVPGLLGDEDEKKNQVAAVGCVNHVKKIFIELADYRAFELLRTNALRTDYLLTKQARIVAMTCTHAAMTRARFVSLGFQYDSVVVEEAGQILEVETMIPMLLQDTDSLSQKSRLKRAVLLGDVQQLPPIIQHHALAKTCRLEQSLFSRLVRSNVPHIILDQQGRARQEIASLYSWKYLFDNGSKELGNLPAVYHDRTYQLANPGFVYTYQFINVENFQNKGEICPTPYYYQNLGEAEYIVAVYQYMRLLGYPADKISILTTYNGQKQLIKDVLSQRCKSSVFGFPSQVTTVDKYQGQQNDFILLSLVRTESVGHLRDVRRLIVALSRARLGLYVFGRLGLFESCFELMPAFMRLKDHPTNLHLVAGESFGLSERKVVQEEGVEKEKVLEVQDVTAMGVLVFQMVQQSQQIQQTMQVATPSDS